MTAASKNPNKTDTILRKGLLKKSPKYWAERIVETFDCPICKGWVASVVWFRITGFHDDRDLHPLEKLMELYPRESQNPYPITKIRDLMKEIGFDVTVDAYLERRETSEPKYAKGGRMRNIDKIRGLGRQAR